MQPKSRTTEVKLEWPIHWKGRDIDSVIVRRPKMEDMDFLPRNMNEISASDMKPFYSNLITLPGGEPAPYEFIGELDASDFNAIGELITSFLQSGRTPQVRRKPVR